MKLPVFFLPASSHGPVADTVPPAGAIRSRPARQLSACLLFALLSLFALSPVKAATEFQLAQWATEINIASTALASELRYSPFYGGLRLRADRLSRESAELVEAIRRNRSSSRVRSSFRDLAGSYSDFEQEFFRANRRQQDNYVFQQVGYISQLFAALNDGYYYSGYFRSSPQVIVAVPGRHCRGNCGSVHPGSDRRWNRAFIGRGRAGAVVVAPRTGPRIDPGSRGGGDITRHGRVELPQAFSSQPRRSASEQAVDRVAEPARGRARVIESQRDRADRLIEDRQNRRRESRRRTSGYHD